MSQTMSSLPKKNSGATGCEGGGGLSTPRYKEHHMRFQLHLRSITGLTNLGPGLNKFYIKDRFNHQSPQFKRYHKLWSRSCPSHVSVIFDGAASTISNRWETTVLKS